MNDKQFPLAWPMGWKRTNNPQYSRFRPGSVSYESKNVFHQLRLMGARNIVISSNMRYRQDGLPYAQQNVTDKGVAVYFTLDGVEQCIPCDKWYSLEANLRAISKTIEALRGIERWGAKEMVNAAFRGFQALPESIVTAPPKRDWWVILGVSENADAPTVKQAYRKAQSVTHPDVGGNDAAFKEVQEAYEEWRNL